MLWTMFRAAGDVIFVGEDVEKERCSVRGVFSGIYEAILTEVYNKGWARVECQF